MRESGQRPASYQPRPKAWVHRRSSDAGHRSASPKIGRPSLDQLPGCLDGIDFAHRLIGANACDAGETHGEAAIMAVTLLDFVESDLEDDVRFDLEITSALPFRMFQEVPGQELDFGIGQTAVSFTNRLQLAGDFIPHGKGVVAEDFISFAVAIFSADNDAIQCAQSFLQLQPHQTAPARCIYARWIFDH